MMSDCQSDTGIGGHQNNSGPQNCQGHGGDDACRLKRREKNRVAARKSRKRQTQKADLLHQAYVYLEQRNSQLKKEVSSLSEEQFLLMEVLRMHEPTCPIMHCFTPVSSPSSSSSSLTPKDTTTTTTY